MLILCALQMLVLLLLLCVPPLSQIAVLANLTWWHLTHMGRLLVFFGGGYPRHRPNLWLHSLKKKNQIRRGNTYGDGRWGVLGGQPRHCICTNASRGLSATAEFLVQLIYMYISTNYSQLGGFPERDPFGIAEAVQVGCLSPCPTV